MNIYECDHVRQVRNLHQDILTNYSVFRDVRDLLDTFAENLFIEFNKGNQAVAIEISNHHPLFIGNKHEEILNRAFTLRDAQLTIAREYGFDDWRSINGKINKAFEQAVDLLLNGDLSGLKNMVDLSSLINERSSFGHKATLLHYASSNGIEIWRQRVPENLAEVTDWLIRNGADRYAKASFYGGIYTPLELATTSAHPKDAGIAEKLETSLASNLPPNQ